jgi:hypothetical protein
MNDVNLIFVSPISARKILLYGIMRLVKASFLAGFFILFQANSLANFGIDYRGVLLIVLGFMLNMIVMAVASLLIYSKTNGNAQRQRIVKLVAALLFLPLAVYIAAQYFSGVNLISIAENVSASLYLRLIPASGWTTAGVSAFLAGDIFAGFCWFGLTLLFGVGLIAFSMQTNPDYYEDVLVATETAHEKKRAIAEGNISAANAMQKRVKVTRTGISGSGASALLGKHLRESFRQNRFGLLTLPSVSLIASSICLSMILKDFFIALQILMWVQMFLIGMGRGLIETYSHYIYLIPETSFKKIIWSNMEVMLKTVLEAVLIFGVSGILLASHPLYILVVVLIYVLFSFTLLGVNYLSIRFTSADLSQGMLIIIYTFAVIAIMLPGVIGAMVVVYMVGGDSGFFLGLVVIAAWELTAGLVCFALSKGVLDNCDMPVVRQK